MLTSSINVTTSLGNPILSGATSIVVVVIVVTVLSCVVIEANVYFIDVSCPRSPPSIPEATDSHISEWL